MSAAGRSIGSTDREVEVALFKRLPGDTVHTCQLRPARCARLGAEPREIGE